MKRWTVDLIEACECERSKYQVLVLPYFIKIILTNLLQEEGEDGDGSFGVKIAECSRSILFRIFLVNF
ncbi:Uncharacterised protein [uncultured Ruminococcus sp.]|nr:Uncharacterised protein [uncultured Ruminococcus sp.]